MRSYFDEDVVTTSQYIWYVCARRRTTVLVQFGPAFDGLMQLLVAALPLDCAAWRGGSGGLPPTTTSLARFRRRRAARSPASERSFIYPLPN